MGATRVPEHNCRFPNKWGETSTPLVGKGFGISARPQRKKGLSEHERALGTLLGPSGDGSASLWEHRASRWEMALGRCLREMAQNAPTGDAQSLSVGAASL